MVTNLNRSSSEIDNQKQLKRLGVEIDGKEVNFKIKPYKVKNFIKSTAFLLLLVSMFFFPCILIAYGFFVGSVAFVFGGFILLFCLSGLTIIVIDCFNPEKHTPKNQFRNANNFLKNELKVSQDLLVELYDSAFNLQKRHDILNETIIEKVKQLKSLNLSKLNDWLHKGLISNDEFMDVLISVSSRSKSLTQSVIEQENINVVKTVIRSLELGIEDKFDIYKGFLKRYNDDENRRWIIKLFLNINSSKSLAQNINNYANDSEIIYGTINTCEPSKDYVKQKLIDLGAKDENIFKGFMNHLENGNIEEQMEAVKVLGELGDKKAVEPLIQSLKSNLLDKQEIDIALKKIGNNRYTKVIDCAENFVKQKLRKDQFSLFDEALTYYLDGYDFIIDHVYRPAHTETYVFSDPGVDRETAESMAYSYAGSGGGNVDDYMHDPINEVRTIYVKEINYYTIKRGEKTHKSLIEQLLSF